MARRPGITKNHGKRGNGGRLAMAWWLPRFLWTIDRDPVLRAPIVTVVLPDQAPDWDAVREKAEQLTVREPRLRAKAVSRSTPNCRSGNRCWSQDSYTTTPRSSSRSTIRSSTESPASGTSFICSTSNGGSEGCPRSIRPQPVRVSATDRLPEAPTPTPLLGAALLTSAGRQYIGINIDTSALTDGDVLVDCMRADFEEIASCARTEPP
jgi:hypothetical protein